MGPRGKTWTWVALGAVALMLAAACGVAQEEYDLVKSQVASEQQKATSLQQQLSAKLVEITQLQQQVAAATGDASKLQEQITAKEKEAADLQAQLGAFAGVTPLIYAKPAPTPTPRPAPTPPPPGFVPPPPAVPDAAFVNEVVPFAFYVETLATSSVSKYGYASYPACVPNSQFKRGTKLVWRFEVIDTSTGKRVTGLEGAKMEIVLPHGEKLTSRYSKRGGIGPWTWSGGWDIPPDYPLGVFDYQLVVTMPDGRTGTFDQDKVALVRAATQTAAGIDSRVHIIE